MVFGSTDLRAVCAAARAGRASAAGLWVCCGMWTAAAEANERKKAAACTAVTKRFVLMMNSLCRESQGLSRWRLARYRASQYTDWRPLHGNRLGGAPRPLQ